MEPNGTDSQGEDEFGLSKRQLAALPYLIAAPTLSEGARLAQIGRITLHRWIQDPHFRMERELQGVAGLALSTSLSDTVTWRVLRRASANRLDDEAVATIQGKERMR